MAAHKAIYEQKDPYSRKQLDLIYEEALKLKRGTHAFAKHPQTFVLLLSLMEETAMRIGDALW
ncbi:MAG: hypothetical protein WB992_02475 [Bryobacteraceae bacterium]